MAQNENMPSFVVVKEVGVEVSVERAVADAADFKPDLDFGNEVFCDLVGEIRGGYDGADIKKAGVIAIGDWRIDVVERICVGGGSAGGKERTDDGSGNGFEQVHGWNVR